MASQWLWCSLGEQWFVSGRNPDGFHLGDVVAPEVVIDGDGHGRGGDWHMGCGVASRMQLSPQAEDPLARHHFPVRRRRRGFRLALRGERTPQAAPIAVANETVDTSDAGGGFSRILGTTVPLSAARFAPLCHVPRLRTETRRCRHCRCLEGLLARGGRQGSRRLGPAMQPLGTELWARAPSMT